METKEIINIIAIMASPIIAVLVGQYMQHREKRRKDKMDIFRTLMVNRGIGWSIDSVKALNIIEVVFSSDKKVLVQWKAYYNSLCVDNPDETGLSMITTEGEKLLDVMAHSLGYKDVITQEIIQNPYVPKGLVDSINKQQQFQSVQLGVFDMMNKYMQQQSINSKENTL